MYHFQVIIIIFLFDDEIEQLSDLRRLMKCNRSLFGQLTHLQAGDIYSAEALKLICKCVPSVQVFDAYLGVTKSEFGIILI